MRLRRTGALLLWTAAISLLMGACGDGEATPSPLPLRATATPLAPTQATVVGTPTPTPVPLLEKRVAQEFAIGHREITKDWDQFHTDFDAWREGLAACDASSVQVSLNGFAGRFIDITEMARALPRDSVVREMANKVVAGTETEEEAIRHLRDNWQSEDSGGYDNVDVKRSAASALQKEVEDALSDLRDKTAPPSRASVDAFSAAFQQLNAQWDEFRLSYDAFRAEEPKLTSSETLGRLSQLVDELRAIVVAVRQLPTSEATRHVAETLSEAAEEEDLALRKLRGTVPGSQEGEAFEPQPGEGETQPGCGVAGAILGGGGIVGGGRGEIRAPRRCPLR